MLNTSNCCSRKAGWRMAYVISLFKTHHYLVYIKKIMLFFLKNRGIVLLCS